MSATAFSFPQTALILVFTQFTLANSQTVLELQAGKNNRIRGFALCIDSNCKLLDNFANIA